MGGQKEEFVTSLEPPSEQAVPRPCRSPGFCSGAEPERLWQSLKSLNHSQPPLQRKAFCGDMIPNSQTRILHGTRVFDMCLGCSHRMVLSRQRTGPTLLAPVQDRKQLLRNQGFLHSRK